MGPSGWDPTIKGMIMISTQEERAGMKGSVSQWAPRWSWTSAQSCSAMGPTAGLETDLSLFFCPCRVTHWCMSSLAHMFVSWLVWGWYLSTGGVCSLSLSLLTAQPACPFCRGHKYDRGQAGSSAKHSIGHKLNKGLMSVQKALHGDV